MLLTTLEGVNCVELITEARDPVLIHPDGFPAAAHDLPDPQPPAMCASSLPHRKQF